MQHEEPLRVYVAAPRTESERAARMAGELRAAGYEVVSTWFERVDRDKPRDPESRQARRRLRAENRKELDRADVVVALCDEGLPAETFFEMAFAIESQRHVVWLQGRFGEGAALSDAAPEVTVVLHWDDVLLALRDLQGELEEPLEGVAAASGFVSPAAQSAPDLGAVRRAG